MHELALNNFDSLGFMVPEDFTGGGTIETSLGIVDVKVHTHIPNHGNLVLPVEPKIERILMETVFSTMGG